MIYNIKVLHKQWEIRLLLHKTYKRKYGEDSCGICDFEKRRISISHKFIDHETIVHELVHAYLHELCISRADIDAEALEEVFCEMMSKYGATLLRQARRVHKHLKQYEVENENI